MSQNSTEPVQSIDIGKTEYASYTRKLMQLVNKLTALGARAEFDLPRIAVIGNQSAGKSSLVEAISRITVPRAAGTCTRCPMEVRLVHALQPWRAQVLLRIEKDANGQRLIQSKEVKFGPSLTVETQLEVMIQRAQLAVLNPSVPAQKFVDLNMSSITKGVPPLGSTNQMSFSSNVVCIEVESPLVTDLSFVDLPGIISNVGEDDDGDSIELIKNLVKEYIKGNTLILVTITTRDDINNQSAALLAKQSDPTGSRTIGALTKPDLLQKGEESEWLGFLEGNKHPLRHGYYITKQRGYKELESQISFEAARSSERTFFENGPWGNVSPKVRARLGTPALTQELSKLLSGLISQILPQLRKDAKDVLAKTVKDLSKLPLPPSQNPVSEVLRLVTSFANEINAYIQASNEGIEMGATHPHFIPFRKQKTELTWTLPFTKDDDQYEDENIESYDKGDVHGLSMDLDDIRIYIENSRTRQLPMNVPYSAKSELMTQCFEDWEIYCTACFDDIHNSTHSQLSLLAKDHFRQYSNTPFLDHVLTILEGVIERSRSATLERIKWALSLENPPFSLNDHYYIALRERYLGEYNKAHAEGPRAYDCSRPVPVPSVVHIPSGDALNALKKIGIYATDTDLNKLRAPALFDEELNVMAEVQAYFRVSYKRIIDLVPRIIDHDFLRTIGGNVQDALVEGLGLVGADAQGRAATYLAEDEQVTVERAELTAKRDRLEEVLKALFSFSV